MQTMNETNQPREIFGVRTIAVVEAVVILLVITLIDFFFFSGNRFMEVNPHPFFIPVLLVAAQYGSAEGILTALLATLFYLVGNIPAPAQGVDHYDYIYGLAINPVLWFVTGWGLGELRQRHVRERERLRRELQDAQQREELISSSYTFVKNRKEALEVQVSGQISSSVDAFRAAKAVETLDPKAVMQGVEQLVKAVLGPQKFSLYILHDNKLTATILHGWAAGEPFAQVIDSYSPLFQAVVGRQELLVVVNEDHQKALDSQGIIAGPILDPETKQVLGMLKVEQIDFVALNLNTIEAFRSLSEWIGMALINARNYQLVKSEAMVNPEHNMLSYSYFRRQSDYLTRLAKRVGFSVSMIVIKLNEAQSLSDVDRVTVARQIGESVRTVLRSVDMAFDYQTEGGEYSILLPATGLAGATNVRDKIAKDIDRVLRGSRDLTFNYVVSALYETR